MKYFRLAKTACCTAGVLLLCGGMAVNAHAADCDVFIIDGASQNGSWSGSNPETWTPNGTIPSLVSASEINDKLGNDSVTIATATCAAGSGDITVNQVIEWDANDHTLKLGATRSVNINAEIKVTGDNAKLELGLATMTGTVKTKLNKDDGFVGKVSFTGANPSLKIRDEAYTIITDATGLAGVASALAGKYALGNNIDHTSDHTPIGDSSTAFTGVFDGLGNKITGLNIAASKTGVGLFWVVSTNGAVRNLGVETGEPHIVANNAAGQCDYAGVIAGVVRPNGKISNSYAKGKVTMTSTTTSGTGFGGLAGGNLGTIEDSFAAVDVVCNGESAQVHGCGGLVGINGNLTFAGTIQRSFTFLSGTGKVTAGNMANDVGGLVGSQAVADSKIENSYSAIAVEGTSSGSKNPDKIGGLVGNLKNGKIEKSHAVGKVNRGSANNFGGLFGLIDSGAATLTNNFFGTDATKGTNQAGCGMTTGSEPYSGAGCTGLASGQMNARVNFTDWNFGPIEPVWYMAGDYPLLYWGKMLPTKPGAPTIGIPPTAGDRKVTVAWDAPATSGHSPILNYTVTYSGGSSTGSKICPPPAPEPNFLRPALEAVPITCDIENLTGGQEYTFTVKATNAVGDSVASSEVKATPTATTTVPGAPTIGTASAGNAQATVSWTVPADNGGSAITSYTATSNPGGRTCTYSVPPPPNLRATLVAAPITCTVTGLSNGTSYTFTVKATNAVGEGPASAPSNSVTPRSSGGGGGGGGAPSKVPQTISELTFNPASIKVGGSSVVSATATSELLVTFSSMTPSVCTVSGSAVVAVSAGTCTVAADQAGNSTYSPAPQKSGSLSISKIDQSIGALSFNPASIKVGGSSVVSATASSKLPVSFSSVTASVCTVSGSTVTAVSVGTCTVAADQAGDASYNAAKQATSNLSVEQNSHTVTAQAGDGGSISPPTRTVQHGVTTAFTVTPKTDYEVASVAGCGGTLHGSTYVTRAITEDCTVTASFKVQVVSEHNSLVFNGDYNGDGRADLIWHNDSTGDVYGILLDGFKSILQGFFYHEPNTAWEIVQNGDFQGRGYDSLLWWNSGNGWVYHMTVPVPGRARTGVFIYHEPRTAWQIVAVGDLNHDGRDDLIWWNDQTGQVWGMLTDDALLSGLPAAQQGQIYEEPNTNWRILAARDFNGDGNADLLWRNQQTGEIYLLLMDGLSIVDRKAIYAEPRVNEWNIVAVADLNGDGKVDLVWWDSQNGLVWGMLMDGFRIAQQGSFYQEPDTSWHIVSSGDYNGDGKDDLLWRHQVDGRICQLPMNGLATLPSSFIYHEARPSWHIVADANGDTTGIPAPSHALSGGQQFAPLGGESLNPYKPFAGEPLNPNLLPK